MNFHYFIHEYPNLKIYEVSKQLLTRTNTVTGRSVIAPYWVLTSDLRRTKYLLFLRESSVYREQLFLLLVDQARRTH